jgi:hypothetical protein
MIPDPNPHRDDIVARIFENLLNGSLEREEVAGRVKVYITELNKLYPTQYRKFGDSLLVSLDVVLFDDGTATRGDTVSCGLCAKAPPEGLAIVESGFGLGLQAQLYKPTDGFGAVIGLAAGGWIIPRGPRPIDKPGCCAGRE